ncbi:hypothetical protein V5799_019883 [Amblyomma americanum]|uniref:Secreted protein n=1 Tax=Amblyomma americanum TaxID=6943 RepID=A0AAQ4EVG9_AMBAM
MGRRSCRPFNPEISSGEMASTSMLFLAVAMLCAAAAAAGEDTEPSGGTGLQGRQEETAEIVEALGELIEAIPTLSPRDSGSPPPLGLVATPSPEFLESRRTRQPSHPPVHTPLRDQNTEPRGGDSWFGGLARIFGSLAKTIYRSSHALAHDGRGSK